MNGSRSSLVSSLLVSILIVILVLVSPLAMAGEVNVSKWMGPLTLGPGKSATWFQDNVSQSAVRWFTVVPVGITGIDDYVRYDQQIEITRVFYILKGDNHSLDGSGGARSLQVNVTVRNLDSTNPATFMIYKAETR